jgi:hypothetical protein
VSEEKSASRIELLLEEILKWTRFAGAKGVKDTLDSALNSEQKRIVYHFSDGKNGSAEIGRIAGVSDWTVRSYWKTWARQGIMEVLKGAGGDRYRKSFDLEELGIGIPKTPQIPTKVDMTSQETSGGESM